MKISVIIPTLNEAAHIGILVQYLLEHGKEHLEEIIVVDGKSTDATRALAEAAGAKVYVLEQEPSRALQMNLGAENATAALLYFVHADSLPPATFATDILKELDAGYSMGCFRYQFDSPRSLLKFNAWFVRFPWIWCQGGDKTFFIRREVFWEFNGYDPAYVVMEEYDFLCRSRKKYPLRIIPKNVLVSARKYTKNSWFRVQVANMVAFTMFRFRRNPRRIRQVYKMMLH